MRKLIIALASLAAIAAAPSSAFALKRSTAVGAGIGAVGGAVIGGPVGAVAGGVAGGYVGSKYKHRRTTVHRHHHR
jgi:hypothetical protein